MFSLSDYCRYWAVTDIDYAHQRTAKRIGIMIVILWILSFLVSIAPMLGWKDPEWDKRLENYECLVSQDIGYQVFATASSFYVPLLAILFLYWRIFLVARKRIRKRQQVIRCGFSFFLTLIFFRSFSFLNGIFLGSLQKLPFFCSNVCCSFMFVLIKIYGLSFLRSIVLL